MNHSTMMKKMSKKIILKWLNSVRCGRSYVTMITLDYGNGDLFLRLWVAPAIMRVVVNYYNHIHDHKGQLHFGVCIGLCVGLVVDEIPCICFVKCVHTHYSDN